MQSVLIAVMFAVVVSSYVEAQPNGERRLCGSQLMMMLKGICPNSDAFCSAHADILPLLENGAETCCSRKCSFTELRSICCAGQVRSNAPKKVIFSPDQFYETFPLV